MKEVMKEVEPGVVQVVDVPAGALLPGLHDGASWSTGTLPVPPGCTDDSLKGGSCATASSCLAVGSTPVATPSGLMEDLLSETWNGTAWSYQVPPQPAKRTQAVPKWGCVQHIRPRA